jgi:hypothetical protein
VFDESKVQGAVAPNIRAILILRKSVSRRKKWVSEPKNGIFGE